MNKAEMTKVSTAAARAVRTFITGSSNLNNYGADIRDIGNALGLRLDDLDNIKRTRGSWLGTMVDYLGEERVTAVYQLINNNDVKPSSWVNPLTAAQQAALNIQQKAGVYASFKSFKVLWNAGIKKPDWLTEAELTGRSSKQTLENLAVRAASNATANCGETSLLAFLLLGTLPKDGKYAALYDAIKGLTVGWYGGTQFDHAYVIVSNHGYATDKGTAANYCVCDPWLGCAFATVCGDLHYDGANVNNIGLCDDSMPELTVGSYSFASSGEALTKIKGTLQLFHSAFLDEWNAL
jgi:hypothetical protein